MHRITLSIPDDLKKRAEKAAASEFTSLTGYILHAVSLRLDAQASSTPVAKAPQPAGNIKARNWQSLLDEAPGAIWEEVKKDPRWLGIPKARRNEFWHQWLEARGERTAVDYAGLDACTTLQQLQAHPDWHALDIDTQEKYYKRVGDVLFTE